MLLNTILITIVENKMKKKIAMNDIENNISKNDLKCNFISASFVSHHITFEYSQVTDVQIIIYKNTLHIILTSQVSTSIYN